MDMLWPDDGGLDDDGRDEIGDSLDEFKCSGDVDIFISVALVAISELGFDGCVICNVRPTRRFAKSQGKNGFLLRKSGWAKWNGGRYVAADDGINPPGITPACDGNIGWPGCNGLNSTFRPGGRTVGGMAPGNVGDTAKNKRNSH